MDLESIENVSAYMMHHVLNKGKTKTKNKRLQNNIKPITNDMNKNVVGANKQSKRNKKKNKKKKLANLARKAEISSQESANSIEVNTSTLSPIVNVKSPRIAKKSIRNNQVLNLKFTKNSFEKNFVEKTLFQWLINPISVDDFFENYWEKNLLLVKKKSSEFSLLLNTPLIDNLLHHSNIVYTKNIDITIYSDGVKELHNLEGVARPHVVWDFYCNKCSLRLLNPQTFVPNIHKLNSELQEFFGCFVGCNAYLTPPHSQGFAPHYDDIEAFILQIEGKKYWKIYKPISENEVLPRYSSCDFTEEELGEPIKEVCLEEGDLLYLPRGYIHQAATQDSNHSLHITISVFQCNAYIDLLEKVIPKTLERAWKSDVEFRKGLPLDYLNFSGFAKNINHKDKRIQLKNTVKHLIHKLADYVQLDSATDQLGLKLMYDALPPVLTEEEIKCSVYGGGLKMSEKGIVTGVEDFVFTNDVEVVLLRVYVSRFVRELEKTPDGKEKIVHRLYYTTDNSLEYHAETPSFLIIRKQSVKCIQALFQHFPNFISIGDLPHENEEEKVNLMADLWERGIIRTKKPILN